MFGSSRRGKKLPKHQDFHKKYTLSSKVLGKGAYAEVVLGQCIRTGQSVAVKRITKEGLRHRDMQKIHKEVGILKSLSHRNIVKVYDSYEDENFFYMVMDYIKGGELFKRIVDDEVRFDEAASRKIIRTLLMALKYCKDNGVVHRDLKPENILMTEKDEVKLVDFNLAKQVDKDAVGFNILETMCGTPNYVAPEIIDGTPYDYKCDIWSTGVISYLLLSGGYLPFYVNQKKEGRNARNALLKKVQEGRWRFTPEPVWIDISPEAKDFVSKMLVRNPEARYNYEQLLAHPWMKTRAAMLTHRIETKNFLNIAEIRKLREVGAVRGAVNAFADLMNETENLNTTLPTSTSAFPITKSGDGVFDSLDNGYGGI